MDDTALTLATQRAIADVQGGGADNLPEWAKNRLLFVLCQHLLPITNGSPVQSEALEPYVLAFWSATREQDEGNLEWEEAAIAFADLWDGGKVRHYKGNAMSVAEDRAGKHTCCRPELLRYNSERIRYLGHVCYELAKLRGQNGRFFMAQRDAGRILRRDQHIGAIVLSKFCNDGILKLLRQSNAHSRKAREYLYLQLFNPPK